jgi:3-methyladenine DNA glycosylase AlkD
MLLAVHAHMLSSIRSALWACAVPSDVPNLQRFFKTGPGEYAEGDVFIGVRVPATRRVARQFEDVPVAVAIELLKSPVHEERLLALIILVNQYQKASRPEQIDIYRNYLTHTAFINNWDLVDSSAEHIVGAYLFGRSRSPLYRLARAHSLWERRIAIMSTFHFIKQGAFDETLKISAMLLGDSHDLIHKATGWMLREVGKRNVDLLDAFLQQHGRTMPRTMLRYAIEKFPVEKRRRFMARSRPFVL